MLACKHFLNNCHTELHDITTNGLFAGVRSQTEEQTAECGLYITLSLVIKEPNDQVRA